MRIRRRLAAMGVALWLQVVGAAVAGEAPEPFADDCSSVALNNRGQAVLGGNLDWIEEVDGMLFILKRGVVKTGLNAGTTGAVAQWTAKYASVAFSLTGYQHAWAGMNERGLVFSTMGLTSTVNPPPDERPRLTMMWPQYMLDTNNAESGRPGRFPAQAPHRSGRAGLPHPAPRDRGFAAHNMRPRSAI